MYKTLKTEILAEAYGDEDEVIASINAKLDAMIARKKAADALLSAPDPE